VSVLPGPESAANPFSTRCVRPGAVAYRFPAGQSADRLLARLEHNGWQGQIVGPHGSGKSALVATLQEALEKRGRATLLVELHDAQRRLPVSRRQIRELAEGTVVIVDGYEQLGRWSRLWLRRFCRRKGLGLVVTSHRSVAFPDLFRTTTSLSLARKIVEQLAGQGSSPFTGAGLEERFLQHGGNLREVLFDLYDLYERRRKAR
jgi:hypothetical protein